jgi:hypothetical protein
VPARLGSPGEACVRLPCRYIIFCILVYPVGIPLAYAWLLTSHRKQIHRPELTSDAAVVARRKDRRLKKLALLFQAYKPDCW